MTGAARDPGTLYESDAQLSIVGELHAPGGVRHLIVTMESLNEFAEYVGAMQREAIADWLARQGPMTLAEAADKVRCLRAEH